MSRKTVRCAIYTRKSSEEGLEQDFNSLDAQFEACAAYLLSQASEGWVQINARYDDGGLSGGTLERPALQRLLSDVAEGRIDIIVVYKVDRLTRSLLDFARLVEAFDEAGVSFVSVTQSFNTTTSMGRLTLNMLLSFAQFEREVTAERIRDKIAQSKARGMWMGGTPPLGYQPNGKNSLTIVEEHARLIHDIFARYRKLGNVRLLAEQLERDGIKVPARPRQNGTTLGGGAFSRGQLYHILRSPIYAGDIVHKGKVYPGNHPAIIERGEWAAVQQQLSDNVRGTRQAREATKALLAGKLFDNEGEPLIPVHASKPGPDGNSGARRRYRYYVSKGVHHNAAGCTAPAMRIPAQDIEQTVIAQVAALLADPLHLAEMIGINLHPARLATTSDRLVALRQEISAGTGLPLRKLLDKVVVHPDRLELALSTKGLGELLDLERPAHAPAIITHHAAVQLRRSGHSLRLVDDRGVAVGAREPDPTLTGLVVQAHRWWGELSEGRIDVTRIGEREGVSSSWVTRVVRLAFLAPQVTDAILAGKAPVGLDGRALLATGAVLPDWEEQANRFRASR